MQKVDTVAYRRKREGKTHYPTRLHLLSGDCIRLVVRRSLKNISAQLVQYADTGDRVIATASTTELAKKYDWKLNGGNLMSSYLVGMLIARKAKDKGVAKAVLDIGQAASTKGSRVYAVLKGALKGGLQVPHGAEILPSDDRVLGKHIPDAAKAGKGFSKYKAAGVDPTAVSTVVQQISDKIMKG